MSERRDLITVRLLEIYDRDGKLTAEQVLHDATSPDSPLHTEFEWDDRQAAYQYRLEQARLLVRQAQVTIMEREVRRFVFLPSTDSYHPIERAVADKDWRAEMIATFERDAERFHARWANHVHVAEHYRKWRAQTI